MTTSLSKEQLREIQKFAETHLEIKLSLRDLDQFMSPYYWRFENDYRRWGKDDTETKAKIANAFAWALVSRPWPTFRESADDIRNFEENLDAALKDKGWR